MLVGSSSFLCILASLILSVVLSAFCPLQKWAGVWGHARTFPPPPPSTPPKIVKSSLRRGSLHHPAKTSLLSYFKHCIFFLPQRGPDSCLVGRTHKQAASTSTNQLCSHTQQEQKKKIFTVTCVRKERPSQEESMYIQVNTGT